jgi:hypothetical protein
LAHLDHGYNVLIVISAIICVFKQDNNSILIGFVEAFGSGGLLAQPSRTISVTPADIKACIFVAGTQRLIFAGIRWIYPLLTLAKCWLYVEGPLTVCRFNRSMQHLVEGVIA